MSRIGVSICAVLAALGPAAAADWGTDMSDAPAFRGSYFSEPKDWAGLGDEEDTVAIETGLRYWYSWGNQSHTAGAGDFETSDNAHTVEAFLRVDDYLTRSYAKGWMGYSAAISGSYSSPFGGGDVADGHVGFAGADFGWNAFGDANGSGFGGLVGYSYWNDSPRTDRVSFSTATSGDELTYDPNTGVIFFPGDSEDTNIDLHMLRLGLTGRAKIDNTFDISAELAAVPYASIGGILGNHAVGSGTTALGNPDFVKTSATEISGWGYGAMGEVMVGMTPVENLTFRLGGRAWYVQGTYDATYTAAQISDPSDSDPDNPPDFDTDPVMLNQGYIETANPFAMLRYGLLAELTYSF